MWKIPLFIAGFVLLKSALVMLLWNGVVPELFHGPELGYVAALKLVILVKLLVGFGGGFGGGGFRGGWGGRHAWKKRWLAMSEEERQKLREDLRHRCGR
jgi:hypothetical protein